MHKQKYQASLWGGRLEMRLVMLVSIVYECSDLCKMLLRNQLE